MQPKRLHIIPEIGDQLSTRRGSWDYANTPEAEGGEPDALFTVIDQFQLSQTKRNF